MNLSASGDLVLPQQGTCLDQPCQKPEQQEQIGQDTALASCLVFWEKLGSTSLISMDFPDGEGLGYWGWIAGSGLQPQELASPNQQSVQQIVAYEHLAALFFSG